METVDGEGCDSSSYIDFAYVTGECFENGFGNAGQALCEDETVMLNFYTEDDCSGNPVNGTDPVALFATDGCMTVTCATTTTTTTTTTTANPETTASEATTTKNPTNFSQCAAVLVSGVPHWPLDECMETVNSLGSVSSKIYCDGDSVMEAAYDNGDCSGTPLTEGISSYEANCDGMHAYICCICAIYACCIGTHSHHRYNNEPEHRKRSRGIDPIESDLNEVCMHLLGD